MKRVTKFTLIGAVALLISCSGTRPEGVNRSGELLACPETPNCVSSFATDEQHQIAPLSYSGDSGVALETLVAIIGSLERTEVVTQGENYIYAEFTSKMWKFVDDVEFVVDGEKSVINVRSASRLGKSDMGVNRARIEEIRSLFEK